MCFSLWCFKVQTDQITNLSARVSFSSLKLYTGTLFFYIYIYIYFTVRDKKNNLYDLEITSRNVKFTDNCVIKCVEIELIMWKVTKYIYFNAELKG